MKGWIYVATMTNTVGVVKIGYSDRDPDERVKEWSKGTGVPGEGKVEYAAWVNEPEQHERRVHKLLEDKREKGSEQFKCSVKDAYDAITQDRQEIIYEDVRSSLRDLWKENREASQTKQKQTDELPKDIKKKKQKSERIEPVNQRLGEKLKAYQIAWDEIENHTQQSALWKKLLTQNDGHKERTKAAYIRERVVQLLK